MRRLREERVDERGHSVEPKPRDMSSRNGEYDQTELAEQQNREQVTAGILHCSNEMCTFVFLLSAKSNTGSPNGHSPVLNLSKSGGLDQGSTGDQSDRSDGGHSPAPSLIRDEEEHDLSDDNVSEVDEREEKDEGKLFC